jgi:hypothetical protein
MPTIVWSLRRFHLIDNLPKGSKFDAEHYISHILSPLRENPAPYQDDPKRRYVIHTDNARPHCAERVTRFLDHNSPHWAPHPPYSPNLTPQTSGFSRIWKGCFKWVYATNLINFGPMSRKFWGESIVRLWIVYFKNGSFDCKTVLAQMVNMLSNA